MERLHLRAQGTATLSPKGHATIALLSVATLPVLSSVDGVLRSLTLAHLAKHLRDPNSGVHPEL